MEQAVDPMDSRPRDNHHESSRKRVMPDLELIGKKPNI